MTKPLIALCLLALSLPLACGVDEETPPDPLATRTGFCQAWGENACQPDVVENCNAPDTAACVDSQADFCLGILPENYDVKLARECLAGVKAAYKDAKLSADDIAVVLKLGAPCDQLSAGTADEGEACSKNDDCNTAGGFVCVLKGAATEGSCEKPVEVGAGQRCKGANEVCPDGFYCNGTNCVALGESGDTCETDSECAPSDRCVGAADALTCEPRLARSEACTEDADCQSLYCAKADGETEGLCAGTIVLSLNEPLCAQLR